MNVSAGTRRNFFQNLETNLFPNLLDSHFDLDHNRNVFTLASRNLTELENSVRILSIEILRESNHNLHYGVHPNVGTIDVVPFVSYDNSTHIPTTETIAGANSFGQWIQNEFDIAAFFYDFASDEKITLPDLRRKIKNDSQMHEKKHLEHGFVCVGARKPLVAINVDLETRNLDFAKNIVKTIRESSGGIKNVRALAFALGSKNQMQVSMNIIDAMETNAEEVVEFIQKLAEKESITSKVELVGLVPMAQYNFWSEKFKETSQLDPSCVIENRL